MIPQRDVIWNIDWVTYLSPTFELVPRSHKLINTHPPISYPGFSPNLH